MVVNGAGKKSYSEDDLLLSIDKLTVLGCGLRLITTEDHKKYVVSIPLEVSTDELNILSLAENSFVGPSYDSENPNVGVITKSDLISNLRWSEERADRGVKQLIREGIIWVDDGPPSKKFGGEKVEQQLWFPSIWDNGGEEGF